MTLTRLMDLFSAWLDMVAAMVALLLARLQRRTTCLLSEAQPGQFSFSTADGAALTLRLDGADGANPADLARALGPRVKGQPVELRLDGARLLARPLELPRGAEPYLAGIVRAQIDRLTPWSADAALFGWTPPEEISGERIRLLVAATPRAAIAPLLERLKALEPGPIQVSAILETPTGPTPIALLDLAGAGAGDDRRIRSVLMGLLAGAAFLATAALLVSGFAVSSLDEDLAAIEQKIDTTRRVLMAGRDGSSGGGAVLRALEQRKRELPAATLALEDLSRVLPDDTYITDLEFNGDRVRIAGVSAAPARLIVLLEQSGRFSGATFVAPTTPLPKGKAERFDIEAQMVAAGARRPEPGR